MNKKTIRDANVAGKLVLIRTDYNVPLDENLKITDDARILKTLPTLEYLLKQNAKVVIMSHLGRPKGEKKAEFSLAPAAKHLSKLLNRPVELTEDCIGAEAEKKRAALQPGQVLMLENLRFHKEEEKNDTPFAETLAKGAEVYVNDAFGAAHRAHASVDGVTRFVPAAVAGLLLEKEIVYLSRVLTNPERPFVAILGGSKVSDKIKVIENLLKKVDTLLIGGGMAYTFRKVEGHKIGNSIYDAAGADIAKEVIRKARESGVKLLISSDFVTADSFSADAKTGMAEEIEDGWQGLDIGPKTIQAFKDALKGAKTILWNGPVGVFEWEKFAKGSRELAQFIAGMQTTSIIGGGDTASAIKQFGLEDKMTHISTGGGASLEFLEGHKLPGIEALNNASAAKV